MTEEYKKLLGAAGYHELALAIRLGVFDDWGEMPIPLSDIPTEILEERSENFWKLLQKPQKEGLGLFEIQKRLKLSEKELYLVFLASLWWVHDGFWPLFIQMGANGPGMPWAYAGMMMDRKNRERTGSVDPERMKRLLFSGFGTEPLLRLDPVMAAHVSSDDRMPLWWNERVQWFWYGEQTNTFVGEKRRVWASNLAEYLRTEKKTVFLDGETGSGRRFLIKQAAGLLHKNLLFVSLTPEILKIKGLSGMIVREALLGQGWPVVIGAGGKPETEPNELHSQLQQLKAQCREEGLPLLLMGEGLREDGRIFTETVPKLSRGERLSLWEILSGSMQLAEDVSLEELADRYQLLPGQIGDILSLAKEQAKFHQEAVIDRRRLFSSCHQYLRQDIGGRAVQVPVRFSWEDLLLDRKQKEKLLRAENQIRFHGKVFETWGLGEKQPYGHGVSLVFSGPPGTGKTMAAQVLAGRIGMELYRVELPTVVSKYIGETEKNLNEIFERAEKAQVVLFFDEADVLFGKRTDVRDSNDKYSNMEAAFLLQKMESYSGVTILATNFLRNMDEAFKRRIRYLVEFPFPDRHWRAKIWQQAFPAQMPLKPDIDRDFLAAAFELSGAGIRNVVLEAAFLAAAEQEAVGMSQLVRAIRNELEKNGKTMTPEECGPYGAYLDEEKRYV